MALNKIHKQMLNFNPATAEEVGDLSLLPTWLQNSLTDAVNKVNNYARDFGVNVRQPPYNVSCDGTDESAKVQQAHDDFIEGGVLYFPDGNYKFNVIINKPLTIRGAGLDTKIQPANSGYIFDIKAGTILNRENHLQGLSLGNMYLWGIDRSIDAGGIKLESIDHSNFSYLWIEDFRRESINFFSSVRECVFHNIHTRYCGDADNGYPDVNLIENMGSDAHNNIYFDNCFFIYSFGDTFNISTNGNILETGGRIDVRNIKFNQCMIHGYTPEALKYTMTEGQKATYRMKISSANDIRFLSTRFHIGGKSTPTILIENDGVHDDPKGIKFLGSDIKAHYTDNEVGIAEGIKVTAGEVSIDNSELFGNTYGVSSDIGTSVSLGILNDFQDQYPPDINGESLVKFYNSELNMHNGNITNLNTIEATQYKNVGKVVYYENHDTSSQSTAHVFKTTDSSGLLKNRMFIGGGQDNPSFDFLNHPTKRVAWENGTSEQKPLAPALSSRFFDITEGKPLWYNGSEWVDASGGNNIVMKSPNGTKFKITINDDGSLQTTQM